jgi:hypothetical protein
MASNATMIAAMPNQARRDTRLLPCLRPCTGAGAKAPGGGGVRGGVVRAAVAGSIVSGYSCRTTISSGGAVVLTGWFAASITFTDPGDVSLRVGVIRSATRSADPVKVCEDKAGSVLTASPSRVAPAPVEFSEPFIAAPFL